MSMYLAIRKIGEYTANIGRLSEYVSELESQSVKALEDKNNEVYKDIIKRLAQAKTLLNMLKDFLEFWKEVLKGILGIMKMFNELVGNR